MAGKDSSIATGEGNILFRGAKTIIFLKTVQSVSQRRSDL